MAPPPGFTKECTEVFFWIGEPSGSEIKLGSLPAYVASPPDASAVTDGVPAILLIADIWGWKLSNSRLLCDTLAARTGYYVYMPDFFSGDSFGGPSDLQRFVGAHGPESTQPLLDAAIAEIKAKHGESGKIGAVGYCWGGRYALRLGAEHKVVAAVACHPSRVQPEVDNLKSTTAASLFLLAANDQAFWGDVKAETEKCVQAAGVASETVVYDGVKHGFAVRCSEDDETATKARDDAMKRTANWFATYL